MDIDFSEYEKFYLPFYKKFTSQEWLENDNQRLGELSNKRWFVKNEKGQLIVPLYFAGSKRTGVEFFYDKYLALRDKPELTVKIDGLAYYKALIYLLEPKNTFLKIYRSKNWNHTSESLKELRNRMLVNYETNKKKFEKKLNIPIDNDVKECAVDTDASESDKNEKQIIDPVIDSSPILSKESEYQIDKNFGTIFIEKRLPEIMSKMPRRDDNVNGIIFLDIDDLTVINKKFGREVGDIVLQEIENIIKRRSVFRYSGRCGDDTFYGVLFKTNAESTYDVCRKIKKDISYYEWRSIADKLRVTCTIGSAMMKENEDPYSWFERSIIGMVRGKEKGGNIIEPGPLYLSQNQIRVKEEELSREQKSYDSGCADFSLRRYFS